MSNLVIVLLVAHQGSEWYSVPFSASTSRQIAENFNRNIDRFVVGRDYVLLEGTELKAFKHNTNNIGFANNLNKLYLWTSRGANRHSKILDTDRAWAQFDVIEETYYRVSTAQKLPRLTLKP